MCPLPPGIHTTWSIKIKSLMDMMIAAEGFPSSEYVKMGDVESVIRTSGKVGCCQGWFYIFNDS